MNSHCCDGRIASDIKLDYTKGEKAKARCSFDIAWNDYKKVGHFFHCIAWGKTAEAIGDHCVKGDRVLLRSELRQAKWQTRDGQNRSRLELLVQEATFLSPPPAAQGSPDPDVGASLPSDADAPPPDPDDEIPF